MQQIIQSAKKIKCLICDVDGVLTDGLLCLDNTGNALKTFHVHDGLGLKLLMSVGIEVAVITTERNMMIDHRMQQLGIQYLFKGQFNKQNAYQQLKSQLQLTDEQFAYIGDDLPDLPIIKQVGLGIAVANAVSQVKALAAWQTQARGGHGAVREVCDLILNAQNQFEAAMNGYLFS